MRGHEPLIIPRSAVLVSARAGVSFIDVGVKCMTQTATGAPGKGNGTSTRRRGSTFSDRQIAQSVKDGKPIMVGASEEEEVWGWVYGADDFHWGIVTTGGETYLVHKTAPLIRIMHPVEVPDHVSEMVAPYQRYVLRHHFSQPTSTDNP